MSQFDKNVLHVLYFGRVQKYLVWDDYNKFTTMTQQELIILLSMSFKIQRDLLGLEDALRRLEFLESNRVDFDLPRSVFFKIKERMVYPSKDLVAYVKELEGYDEELTSQFLLDGVPFDLIPGFLSITGAPFYKHKKEIGNLKELKCSMVK